MRIHTIAGISALALGLLAASGAMAAPSSADSLSGTPAASMTCGEFTKLSPTARADLVKQIDEQAPPSSLTSNSGTSDATNSANAPGSTSGALGVDTQLTGGQLVSACEGASPSSTLQDAFSHANSGNSPAALGK